MNTNRREEAIRTRKNASWSLLLSFLCGILAVIDLEKYLSKGWIVIGRESRVLTGSGARTVIVVFALAAAGFLIYGVHLFRTSRRLAVGSHVDEKASDAASSRGSTQ